MSRATSRITWVGLVIVGLAALLCTLDRREPGDVLGAGEGTGTVAVGPVGETAPPEDPRKDAQRREPVEAPPAPRFIESPAADAEPRGAGVSVRFVDQQGSPVGGVEFTLLELPALTARSTSDGVARLSLEGAPFGGPTRACTFEAGCAGFARERRKATAAQGKELLLGDWPLTAGGSIEGTVVDGGGRGLPGVQVACLGDEHSAAEWERARRQVLEALWRPGARTRTEPDGSFRLDEVPAGEVRIVAVADDRPAARTEPIDLPAGGLVRGVRIAMEDEDGGTTIEGIVLDPFGHPLPRAQVQVRSQGTQYGLTAGLDGRFIVRLEDKQPRDITAFDPEQRHREATRRGVVPGTKDLELRLGVAPEIQLSVRSKAGQPIERFAVAVIAKEGAQPLAFFAEDEHAGGRFAFGAPAQDHWVEVRANGWLPARLGPFSAEAPPRELAAVLTAARGVRGRVTAAGSPREGVTVALHEAAEKNDAYNGFPLRVQREPSGATETDAKGEFALSVERSGSFYLRAELEGFAIAERGPLALSPDSEHGEDLELDEGGTLAVRVRSSAGASAAGLLVAFSRGDGLACTERTDERGEVALTRLTPGPWQVQLSKTEIDPRYGVTTSGTKPAKEIPSNCRVLSGEVTRVDLWLEGGDDETCSLTGRLTVDGKAADGWVAALDHDREVVLDQVKFLEPGLFRIGVDGAGTYRLRLSNAAGDPSAMLVILDEVTLTEGQRFWSLDLETGSLEGTLRAQADPGALVFCRWQRGDLEVLAPLVPDADGRFRCGRVPAGRGAIVRFDPARPIEEQTPAVLRELMVEAGKALTVEL